MPIYDVTVTRISRVVDTRTFVVEAESREAAIDLVSEMDDGDQLDWIEDERDPQDYAVRALPALPRPGVPGL